MCRLSHLPWIVSVLLAAVVGFVGGQRREHLATRYPAPAASGPEAPRVAAAGGSEPMEPTSSGLRNSSWACEHVLAGIDAASAAGLVVRDRTWWEATRALTSEDCAVVLKRVDLLPMRFLREDLRVELLERWSGMDCGAALGVVFRPLAAIDPAAAFALMRRFSGGPLLDQERLEIVFVAWSARDPSAAFGAVTELEKDLWAGDEFTAAMTALAECHPAAVCAWIQQNASSNYHDEACAGLVAGLMKGVRGKRWSLPGVCRQERCARRFTKKRSISWRSSMPRRRLPWLLRRRPTSWVGTWRWALPRVTRVRIQ